MKKVRMLLRVSSNQQLESDGDLSVQRELVKEYVQKNSDWQLDGKEYFESTYSSITNKPNSSHASKNAFEHGL